MPIVVLELSFIDFSLDSHRDAFGRLCLTPVMMVDPVFLNSTLSLRDELEALLERKRKGRLCHDSTMPRVLYH